MNNSSTVRKMGGDSVALKEKPPRTGLEECLRQRGILPSDLADELGVTKATVYAWLQGRCEPRKGIRTKVADLLDEDQYYLFFKPFNTENPEAKAS